MTLQVWAGIAVIVVAVLLLVWAAFGDPDRKRRRATSNLRRGLELIEREAPPLETRDRREGLRGAARALTPAGALRRLDLQLARAGRPPSWPLSRVLVFKLILGAVGGLLGLLVFLDGPSVLRLLLAAGFTLLLYFLPDLLIYNTGLKRREQIQQELADTLDQMVIAVEAGLGFEAAMGHAARNGSGPLAEELIRTLQDIQVGQPRKAAYEALSARNEVQDLRRFISAIIQADVYGVAIGDVLRTQASEMRIKRRQRAEEKAMQVPVKIVIPLILCILPVLFIVVIGPGVMDIVKLFGQI